MSRQSSTEAKWAARVAEWRESGQTLVEFAAGRGYAPTTLKWWSHRLDAVKAAARRPPIATQTRAAPAIELVRVSRAPKPEGVERRGGTSMVELETIRVRVEPGVDEAALRAVIAALRGVR